jgi:ABC-type uncharacterized transport system permease subunit
MWRFLDMTRILKTAFMAGLSGAYLAQAGCGYVPPRGITGDGLDAVGTVVLNVLNLLT